MARIFRRHEDLFNSSAFEGRFFESLNVRTARQDDVVCNASCWHAFVFAAFVHIFKRVLAFSSLPRNHHNVSIALRILCTLNCKVVVSITFSCNMKIKTH